MAIPPAKPIHSLVLDTGPIIKNDPAVSTLLSSCDSLYTIPAVVDEIRDEATQARVRTSLLPFLTLRSPRAASVKVIVDFARKTGDLEVLSKTDLHLIALAYELECERNHGDWRLRRTPGQKSINGAPPPEVTGHTSSEARQEGADSMEDGSRTMSKQDNEASTEPALDQSSLSEILQDTHLSSPANAAEMTTTTTSQTASSSAPQMPNPSIAPGTDDSDDDGWITTSNLAKHQAKDGPSITAPQVEPKAVQVALITSDFAMQNVLLRMNLNLLSSNLERIRQIKTWVLRCHACFQITKDMTKQFCHRCGQPTLLRTSCSTDEQGNVKVHLKKNMQWNSRGNIYSVPKPVAGSSNGRVTGGGQGGWGQDLILAEDQKEYVRAMATEKRRKEKDLMDDDFLPSILTGDRGTVGGRPRVGGGRHVNSKKRR